MKKLALAAMAMALASGSLLMAENWPKWRGPNGDAISKDEKFSDTWPEEPKVLWTVKAGAGYASPVVVDGKLYIFTFDGPDGSAPKDEKYTGMDTLRCLDAKDGKELWKKSYEGGWSGGGGKYMGTRALPYIEGSVIYTYGGAGDLTARKLEDGSEIWRINVLKETGTKPVSWAVASNPLIIGDLIYVQTGEGGSIAVAVDKKTGKIVQQSAEKATAGYAAMIPAKVDGTDQIIVFGAAAVYGMTPDLQKTIWTVPWKTELAINASAPIYKDGNLFITSDLGSMMLKLTKDGATSAWNTKDAHAKFQGAILDGDSLFISSDGTIKCLKWPASEVVWQDKDSGDRIGVGGSMVRHGDKLVCLTERGKLLLLEATPTGAKRLASYNKLVEGSEVWSSPLLYDGKIYVKGAEDLVCVDVSK